MSKYDEVLATVMDAESQRAQGLLIGATALESTFSDRLFSEGYSQKEINDMFDRAQADYKVMQVELGVL